MVFELDSKPMGSYNRQEWEQGNVLKECLEQSEPSSHHSPLRMEVTVLGRYCGGRAPWTVWETAGNSNINRMLCYH